MRRGAISIEKLDDRMWNSFGSFIFAPAPGLWCMHGIVPGGLEHDGICLTASALTLLERAIGMMVEL